MANKLFSIIIILLLILFGWYHFTTINKLKSQLDITETNYRISKEGTKTYKNKYNVLVSESGVIQQELDDELLENIILRGNNDSLSDRVIALQKSIKKLEVEPAVIINWDINHNFTFITPITGDSTYFKNEYITFKANFLDDYSLMEVDSLSIHNNTTLLLGLEKSGSLFNRTYTPTVVIMNSNPYIKANNISAYKTPIKQDWWDRNLKWMTLAGGFIGGVLIAK